MRNFAIEKFAVMAYLILLCIVAAVSAKKFMSNVPDAASKLPDVDNITSKLVEGFKKCLTCGCSHAGPEENIIKGDPVDPPNKYPWMVKISTGLSSICGGSILDAYYILSAAHCFINENCTGPLESCKARNDQVVIELVSSSPNKKNIGLPVQEIFTHPQFKLADKLFLNDIAVVKLKNPIACDAYASPICLPPSNFSVPAKRLLGVAGWGMKFFQHQDPNSTSDLKNIFPIKLLEAKVLVLNKIRCGFSQQSDPDVQCVIGTDEKTPCFGDLGGPMFFKKKVFYTLGVASKHISTICDSDIPVIYTDVRKFMKYIQNVTGLASAQEVEVQRKNRRKRNNKRRI